MEKLLYELKQQREFFEELLEMMWGTYVEVPISDFIKLEHSRNEGKIEIMHLLMNISEEPKEDNNGSI